MVAQFARKTLAAVLIALVAGSVPVRADVYHGSPKLVIILVIELVYLFKGKLF